MPFDFLLFKMLFLYPSFSLSICDLSVTYMCVHKYVLMSVCNSVYSGFDVVGKFLNLVTKTT